jgi:cellulose synthase operon protein YhjU
MNLWNFYFISKLVLYFGNCIGFHVLANLGFALALLVPLRLSVLRVLRQVAAIPLAFALLYYDSWFPSFENLVAHAPRLLEFSLGYLYELAGRLIVWQVVAAIFGIVFLCYLVSKRYRLTPIVIASMFVPLFPIDTLFAHNSDAAQTKKQVQASNEELTRALDAFYEREQSRVVSYVKASKSDTPFDIIFLHVCSLSWDDLQAVGEAANPFIKKFNIVFTNFNSATAYSEPSLIRLLHSSCGQEMHDEMYNPAAPHCHTLNALELLGYETNVALNHPGIAGDFLNNLREIGRVSEAPMDISDTPTWMYSYDDAPISNDYAVLSKWWSIRSAKQSSRTVLFYNTITMHDGARHTPEYSKDSLLDYRPRVIRLFSDLDRFFAQIEASGRRAVVVFVPEHGTNLRGDKMQISGMRETPSPGITKVPVGIRLIGRGSSASAKTQVISQPSSYIAVSTIISRMVSNSPFNEKNSDLDRYVADIPVTEFVAENNKDTLIMGYKGGYFLLTKHTKWTPYVP